MLGCLASEFMIVMVSMVSVVMVSVVSVVVVEGVDVSGGESVPSIQR